jgi:hypothetical protein
MLKKTRKCGNLCQMSLVEEHIVSVGGKGDWKQEITGLRMSDPRQTLFQFSTVAPECSARDVFQISEEGGVCLLQFP